MLLCLVQMKKFLFYLFLTLLIPLAGAGYLFWDLVPQIYREPAKAAVLLQARLDHRLYDNTSLALRTFALTHFPSIFPLYVVCDHTGPDGKMTTILPGEMMEAKNHDLLLSCSRDIKILLRKGSKIKIKQQLIDPHIAVLQGTVDFFVNQYNLRLASNMGTLFLSIGEAPENHITISRTGETYTYACQKGKLNVILFENPPANDSSFILAKNCTITLASDIGPTRTLNDGDIVSRKNLLLEKNLWPKENFAKVYAPLAVEAPKEMPIKIQFLPTSPPSNNWRLVWSTTRAGPVSCTIFVRNSEKGTATPAHTFQSKENSGELLLQNTFAKYWTSLSCNSTAGRIDSNLLAPQ